VTPDEIESRRRGNGYDLQMTSAVNGRRYGGDRWTSAYWSFEELISYSSWNSESRRPRSSAAAPARAAASWNCHYATLRRSTRGSSR